MGNYQSLNVLNQKPRKDFMSNDAITEVANMIENSGGNRRQRRKLARDLGKVENILSHTQKRVDRSAYEEYKKRTDMNYVHFFACLGLTMLETYRWKETPDNDHGQIASLFENVDKTIRKYAEMGYETEDIVKLLDEKTGILLVPDAN